MERAAPLSGRRAQAARNDRRILEAARSVFLADPAAPMAAVAKQAGVGMAALYRRYASKEDLLRTLCGSGLRRFNAEAEVALADERDPWTALADFMGRVVEADTHSLTLKLAGSFTPTEELDRDSVTARELTERLFARVAGSGALRPDVKVTDILLVFELVAAVRLGDEQRTSQLRRRYLTLLLDALRAPATVSLPGQPPTWDELSQRWSR
jgi:AcrR family transcriptional regulator